MKLAARTVPLSRKGHRITFDYDGRQYRIAYYYPHYNVVKKREDEKRLAITKRDLEDGLRVLFAEAEAPFDERTVVQYMRETKWGRELP